MPENDDLTLLIDAARRAGEVATQYSGATVGWRDKEDGAGPVTEADLAVNRMLEDRLRAARPDYGWLSEETEDDLQRLDLARVFIVDPIDGTRSFMEGSGTWAHALAVAEHGVVKAAVVYLPMRGLLYAAAAGRGATLNDTPIRVSDRARLTGANILGAKPNFRPEFWRDGNVPDVTRSYRPSLAYRLSVVAEGRFDAMLTLRPSWEWDIAAGDLILQEAGATTSNREARPLLFNNAIPKVNGVVAANPALHREIAAALVRGLPFSA